jgi:N-acetyl-anhydromuramyl-L-alanine amidase AmpD
MDGIGGIIIGSMFKIPPDILPRGYTGIGGAGALVGYLVTSVAHSIGSDNDWKTTLGAQFIILDGGQVVENKSIKSISAAIATKAREVARVKIIPQNTSTSPSPPATDNISNKIPVYTPGTNKGNVKNYNKNNSGKQTPNSIVLHCTAGYGSALDTVNFVNTALSIHYAVDREGNVVQGMDENLTGWHANNKNQGSIGIEIGNISSGFLKDGVIVTDASHIKKKDGTFTPYKPLASGTGTTMESLGFSWNGREYYEQYSDVQINALETLIRGILKRNPGIKLNFTTDFSTIYKNVFGFPGIPEKGKSYFTQKPNGGKGATKDDAGIFTHVICAGSAHGDPPPTYKIISMLSRLASPAAPPPPPPLPPLNYKLIADQIFNALNRSDTNEDGIKAQLNKLRNQNDWFLTIDAYGSRTIDKFFETYRSTLRNTLNNELDDSELVEIKSLLAKKRIDY